MKNLILITILILTFITGDSYSQSYFGKSLFKDRIQANNVLYVTSLAQGTNEHATIASALSAYQTGMVIILAPEYFDEDVTISIDNVHIQGLNKELSKIKSLTVTGGYARLENFTVNGTSTFTSQKANQSYWNGSSNNTINESIDFRGRLNVGTSSTSIKETIKFKDCSLYGTGGLYLYAQDYVYFDEFSCFPLDAAAGARPDFTFYGGGAYFRNPKELWIDTIKYINTGIYTEVGFYNSGRPFFILGLSTVTSTAFHILAIFNSQFDLGDNTAGSITFNGKFELDIFNSSPALWKNIVFNSTANSRIVGMQQRGWQSTSQISGTGLSYLRIYNSSLSGTAPGGLGGNSGNVWSAFMDN